MKKHLFVSFAILLIFPLISFSQAALIVDGINTNYYSVSRSDPAKLIVKRSLFSSGANEGYILVAGDDAYVAIRDNYLDGAMIIGNKFVWTGYTNYPRSILHGVLLGMNKNQIVKHNYVEGVPYSFVYKSAKAEPMESTTGGHSYNIHRNAKTLNIKGMSGVKVFNNTFYNTRYSNFYNIHIYENNSSGETRPYNAAKNVKIKNNIIYQKYDIPAIQVDQTTCLQGFESDYNIFWCEECVDHKPTFKVAGVTRTWEEWRALGYDTHSQVMDPKFIDALSLVPSARMDYGTNLGTGFDYGLATTARWNVGQYPDTVQQNGTWQVGAIVYAPSSGPVGVTGITLTSSGSNTPDANIGIGETLQLTATILPSNASNKNVTWISGNGTIATVNSTGLVTGAAVGSTTITATTVDGSYTASSIITVVGASSYNLFSTQIPASSRTERPGEFGMKFTSSVPGQITTIRYYKPSGESGTHTGRLWSANGHLLASANFSSETSSGWQEASLNSPYPIYADSIYVVSVNSNSRFVYTRNGLQSVVANGPVRSIAGGNGVFIYAPDSFPVNSYRNSNYFRDITFNASTAHPTSVNLRPATVTVGIGETQQLTAAISPSYASNQATTWSSSDAAVVSVDDSGLITGISFGSATISVTTLDGNFTASSVITVTEASPFNLFTSQAPVASRTERPGEFGMKFSSSVPGQIIRIRYYKPSGEGGSHVGRLWSAKGILLASAGFSAETTSGWQEAVLNSPFTIYADTIYVVSVNSNNRYVYSRNGLLSVVTNGPLYSIEGSNGVYNYPSGLFPAYTNRNSNYFRDVTFTASESKGEQTDKLAFDGDVLSKRKTAGTSFSENEIIVFPNPASKHLNVKFNNLEGEEYELSLYNSLSQKMVGLRSRETHITFNIEDFQKGLYVLIIKSNMRMVVKKVILE